MKMNHRDGLGGLVPGLVLSLIGWAVMRPGLCAKAAGDQEFKASLQGISAQVLPRAARARAARRLPMPPLDDAGFERLGPPEPGDWRSEHPEEKFQSIEKYLRELENKVSPDRRTIYIQPLGRVGAEQATLLETVRAYLAAFFGCEAKMLPPIAPPKSAWIGRRGQFEAARLLAFLAGRAPKDAAAVAGFLAEDIFTDDDNFVFGLAQESDRAGIFSLARLGERYPGMPPGATLEQRTLALASHELGHVFGLDHCMRYRCVMNGSNSLEESDRQPLHMCPIDAEKLRLNLGFDPRRRYRDLEAFYRAHGYAREADFCAARKDAFKAGS